MFIEITFLCFICIFIYTDIKYKKIYNNTVLAAIIIGLLLNILYFRFFGFLNVLSGFFIGLIILLPFYLLGGIGAGDIKYLIAIGSLKGPKFLFFGTVYGILLGLIISIIVMLFNNNFKKQIKKVISHIFSFITYKDKKFLEANHLRDERSINLPYAAILSIGMLCQFVLQKL